MPIQITAPLPTSCGSRSTQGRPTVSIPITKQGSLTDANIAIEKLRKAITAIHKDLFKRQQEHLLDLAIISEDKDDAKRTQILRTMAKQEQ